MEKSPKNQKEYFQNRVREFEKRTGMSMNVKGVSNMYYDYDTADTFFNYPAALDLLNQNNIYIYHLYHFLYVFLIVLYFPHNC